LSAGAKAKSVTMPDNYSTVRVIVSALLNVMVQKSVYVKKVSLLILSLQALLKALE
jgi:hypothetical protein